MFFSGAASNCRPTFLKTASRQIAENLFAEFLCFIFAENFNSRICRLTVFLFADFGCFPEPG
jgi:hypothetical protein